MIFHLVMLLSLKTSSRHWKKTAYLEDFLMTRLTHYQNKTPKIPNCKKCLLDESSKSDLKKFRTKIPNSDGKLCLSSYS